MMDNISQRIDTSALFQSFHLTDTYTYCDQRTIVIVDARPVVMAMLQRSSRFNIHQPLDQSASHLSTCQAGVFLSSHGGNSSPFRLAHIIRADIIALE